MKLDYVLEQVLLLPSVGCLPAACTLGNQTQVTGTLKIKGVPCFSLGGPETADVTTDGYSWPS